MKLSTSVLLATASGLAFAVSGADLSPTLEVLPLNSTLSKVTIPRYDANRNRVAYLKADLMEILADGNPVEGKQPIMVDCTGIQLRMSTEKAGGEVSVDMEQARYRITPGVLTVQEQITAKSPQFAVTGNGGIFHLDTQRGFLFGPLDCEIFSKATAQNSPTMTSPLTALLATTSLVAFNPGYKPPTAEELLAVERLAKPSQAKIQSTQSQINKSAGEHERESEVADQKLRDFADAVESKSLNLLIQNPPPANPAAQAKPPIVDPDLTIHCDGGCFFDGNENLLVLLRNVVVKETRFTLRAQEEIKVFFNVVPDEPEAEGANKPDEEENDLTPQLDITEIKSLVATGGVNFSGVDKDGNPVEASAGTAFYNDKEKVLILKDGTPTFWTKKGKLEVQLQAEEPNAFVKIELSGETMSAHTSPTGWKFGGKGLPLKN